MSAIEWTDETWNPLRGCRRISPGCGGARGEGGCYAERQAARPILSGPGKPYEGLVAFGKQGPRWTGKSAGPDKLEAPLHWKKPRKVFVCSMSDLFFEGHSDDAIDRVWAVMVLAHQHTFQVLTKRPERAVRYFSDPSRYLNLLRAAEPLRHANPELYQVGISDPKKYPAENIWIGTSVEDQQRADERIPNLLKIPAAVRFVSYEPALGAVDFHEWLPRWPCPTCGSTRWEMTAPSIDRTPQTACRRCNDLYRAGKGINWLIVGGESGPGARPFDIAWGRSAVAQCKAAGVPVFVKQMGARPVTYAPPIGQQSAESILRHGEYDPDPQWWQFQDRAGGDPAEWPEDLRVREWPEPRP